MTNILETPYNITRIVNSSSLGNLMTNIAPVLNGYYLGNAFLIIIFLVSFIYMKGAGKWLTQSCWMGALSLTMISALFLMSMGMIGAGILWFIVIVWIVSLGLISFIDE